MRRALVWLRRDLRLHDHAVLTRACAEADEVVVAFVFDRVILDALPDRADRRVTFIHRSLQEVDRKLRDVGSRLVVRVGDPVEEIPRLAEELGVHAVFAGRDFEPYAIERDAEVDRRTGGRLRLVKDQVVFDGSEIGPYKVFTPFQRAWRLRFTPADAASHDPDLGKLSCGAPAESPDWSLEALGFQEAELWLEPGADAGRRRLAEFRETMPQYHEERNSVDRDGTSGLSVHLRFGTVSVRECVLAALEVGGEGAEKWLSELVWREFYQSVLVHFPHVVEEPFQPQYRGIEWPGGSEALERWKEGSTGFPIVDAAMRCLNATGWMHNRLRMAVASFLTKDLLVDYRLGEAYFAEKLLDFDLASNNGGWQWAASTGVDAQPYFRIFNPVLQSRKFDPDGVFIRRWCPELKGFSSHRVHWPHEAPLFEQMEAGCILGEDYPPPLVRHEEQRPKALALLSSGR